MSIALSLVPIFGKPLADKLVTRLSGGKGGAQKLEQASAALARGLTAVEALKEAFGKDFLTTLNEVLGFSGRSIFTYEAGTQSYIRLDDDRAAPARVLRDELNINLDRLSVVEVQNADLKNLFLGLVSVWQARCSQFFGATAHAQDIESTFSIIQKLLKGEARSYRQIYHLLSSTSLGGIGALMVISGVFVATGTSVGVVSAISLFLFGIPWMTVGALVLPGALLVVLAAKKSKPADAISLSIALAYKLLERIEMDVVQTAHKRQPKRERSTSTTKRL